MDESAKALPAKCLIEEEVPMNEAEIMKDLIRHRHNSLMFCQKLQELIEYDFAKMNERIYLTTTSIISHMQTIV